MSEIDYQIPPRAFQTILVRIGDILFSELAKQAYYDDELDLDVYIERSVPFAPSDIPAVNVMIARGNFDNYTISNKDGHYNYFIDVVTKSKSTPSDGGDSLSSYHLHKIMGVIDAILSDFRYNTLGFNKPYISRTQVEELMFHEPERSNDAQYIMKGRLLFTVRVPENVQKLTPSLAEGFDTSIKLGNTNKGFKYTDEFYY